MNSYLIETPATPFSKYPQQVVEALQFHLDDHATHNHFWPDNAQFACFYRKRTWPCGWDKDIHAAFFVSADDMIVWIKEQEEWSKLEDNDFLYDAYCWEMGPVLLSKYAMIYSV